MPDIAPAPRFWREVPTVPGTYWDGCKLYDLYHGYWWREQRCIGELEWNGQCWFFGPLPEVLPDDLTHADLIALANDSTPPEELRNAE